MNVSSSDAAICSPSQPPVNTSSLTSQVTLRYLMGSCHLTCSWMTECSKMLCTLWCFDTLIEWLWGFFGLQIVRAETDSGFGSLYLNQTGLFQPNLLAGRYKPKEQISIGCWVTGEQLSLELVVCRVQPQNDALSNSDSEASCSNVQSVQSVATRQGWDSPQHSGVAVGVEQWVENTTKLSSLRLKGD